MPRKAVKEELFEEAFRFEFFQAVRLLEKMFPAASPVGKTDLPSGEAVKFRTRIGLDFPASELHELSEKYDEKTGEKHLELIVNFMGMTGASGVLPTHYTELVADRVRHRDHTLHDFLDLFTHRAVSLFYRAWKKYRFPVSYESGKDEFTEYLFDFIGLGTNGLRGKLFLDDESLLPYGGLIAQKPHSSSAIRNLISDYFGVPAEIQQFKGQWLRLDHESITKLGQENSVLGDTAIIGTRFWDDQSKFRLVLGSLTFKEFQSFLPNGTAYKPACAILRFMVGQELDFDIQLRLKAKEVPGTVLTTRAMRRPMLGWTSFLKTKKFVFDDEQLVLQSTD
jgi:type VI secretion system protein ImpH